MSPHSMISRCIPASLWVLAAFWLSGHLAASAIERLNLAGTWRFELDRQDQGTNAGWHRRTLQQKLRLPGSLQEQGFGDPVTVDTRWTGDIVDRSWFHDPRYAPYRQPGHIKVPFWLQPERHYVGVAWYQRDIEIPPAWAGKRVVLHLERAHWETTVWVDDRRIGSCNSLGTPHEYDLGTALTPGKHRLTVRVDNRVHIQVGVNAHSVSDHTQGNWNGIVGALELRATAPVWVDDVQVYPDVARRCVTIKTRLGNLTGRPGSGLLTFAAQSYNSPRSHRPPPQTVPVSWTPEGAVVECEYPLGPEALLWDEFAPALYRLTATLETAAAPRAAADSRTVSFGLREVRRQGTQIALNGRKLFLRGTLECNIFPLTGYPPTDVEAWKRIIRICQAHGLNHIRFHSHTPPAAAFQAADELGFLYYVEAGSWANQGSSVGDGRNVDAWLHEEAARIFRALGNHPSFIMFSYGNEPAGKNQQRWLGEFIRYCKSLDSRRLYTSGAGWPMIPENDFHVVPEPRIHAWGGGLNSRINARPPETVTDYRDFIARASAPVVSHEIGQWCVFPNFAEMSKYKGWLKPKNFEIFRDFLVQNGLGDKARAFLLASGKLQALCYKEEIESALRTPGMAGFELLDLHDFPGQGTALVGVLDPFWESKGYITAAEYRRFSGPVVPIARLPKRIFTTADTLQAQLELAWFAPQDLPQGVLRWTLRHNRRALATGKLFTGPLPTGICSPVGTIQVPLQGMPAPAKLNLELAVEGTPYANDWDLWVYPAQVNTAPPPDIHWATELDAATLAVLERGGKVLFNPPPQTIRGDALGRVQIGFSSIFWNTAWTRRQAPHTLGIYCDPKHPALAQFPTEYHSNWQWWELVSRAHPFILTGTPPEFRPVVHAIDDWFTSRKLGLIIEAQVGRGRLLACAMDLSTDLAQRPVARQLRRSLLDYMAGPHFKPAHRWTPAQVQALLAPPSLMQKLGARVLRASSEHPDHPARHVVDDDPNTLWHTPWGEGAPGFPHSLVLEFKQPASLRGVTLTPRQDNNKNGWIREFALYVSADGQQWGLPILRAELPASASPKELQFPQTAHGRFLKLEILSGFDRQPFASLAELTVW
ncbi:MAG: discoidin domain-containing protein [Verrucomicrobiae bacterium]|nr:discoidin domain-containing protein [Verrucomicrobiae bacterium]